MRILATCSFCIIRALSSKWLTAWSFGSSDMDGDKIAAAATEAIMNTCKEIRVWCSNRKCMYDRWELWSRSGLMRLKWRFKKECDEGTSRQDLSNIAYSAKRTTRERRLEKVPSEESLNQNLLTRLTHGSDHRISRDFLLKKKREFLLVLKDIQSDLRIQT